MAALTGLKSDQNQLADLFRRVISTAEHPAPKPDIIHGKTVTTASEGVTESATRGCKPSSTDDTGKDVALFPRWTAPKATAASATATYATRLDRRGLFLLWKVMSYSDVLPQLE